ncbi:hypothetical protein [Allohahella sp. A8]|uniref:hypothetical protein n=1 Tax=Allohahella sp. A8 TaxID=3141461 RepID=UPI003A8133F2
MKEYQPGDLTVENAPEVATEVMRTINFLRGRSSQDLEDFKIADPALLGDGSGRPSVNDFSSFVCTRGGRATSTHLAGPRSTYEEGALYSGAGARSILEMNRCDGPLIAPFVRVGSYTTEVVSGLFDQFLTFGSESGEVLFTYERYGGASATESGIYQHGDIRHILNDPKSLTLKGQSYREIPDHNRFLEFGLFDFALTLERVPGQFSQENDQFSSAGAFQIGLGRLSEQYSIEFAAPLIYSLLGNDYDSGTVLLKDSNSTLKLELHRGYTEYHFDADNDGTFETVEVL